MTHISGPGSPREYVLAGPVVPAEPGVQLSDPPGLCCTYLYLLCVAGGVQDGRSSDGQPGPVYPLLLPKKHEPHRDEAGQDPRYLAGEETSNWQSKPAGRRGCYAVIEFVQAQAARAVTSTPYTAEAEPHQFKRKHLVCHTQSRAQPS